MKKSYATALVLIPPKEKWEQIQSIRRKYDPQIHRWMPHINLLYPFISKPDFPTIHQKLIFTCSNRKLFEISFAKFNYFDHGHQNYTLWLVPEPKELIIEIQFELRTISPSCNDLNRFKGGFRPHLSVGQVRGKKKMMDLLQELQNDWQAIKVLIKGIFYIVRDQDKNSPFKIVEEIPFRNI